VAVGFKRSRSAPVGIADGLRLPAPDHRRGLIPEDVTIQVLVQCREELIERTYESLVAAPLGHRALLQLDLRAPATGGLRPRQGGHRRHRSQRGALCKKFEADVPGTAIPLRVLTRELHRHGARVRRRDL